MKKTTKTSKRRINKLPLIGGCLIALLVAGSASAEWKVADEKVRDRIGEGNVNKKLDQIYKQHGIGPYAVSGEAVADPEQKIEKGTITLTTGSERCKSANSDQKATCEEIVKTENSQYLYMVKMFEITTKRKEVLAAIEKEREKLGSGVDNYGKLQSNTNKLIALNTRMALDQAQMESATHAYETRLRYLKQYQTQQTNNRLTGKTSGEGTPFGGLGAIGSTLVAGAVLGGTLEALKSPDPDKRMGWL
jgi:type IV secretion system protein VirB5